MDMIQLGNICAGLELALSRAQQALDSVFDDGANHGFTDSEYNYHSAEECRRLFLYNIERCGAVFAIALDALGLAATRRQLLRKWKLYESAGLDKMEVSLGMDFFISEPLEYLRNIHIGLMAMFHSPERTLQNHLFDRLCEILRDTPLLLRRRSITPEREMDIQNCMHDYLRAFFPDFVLNPKICGSIRNFIPDCGIRTQRVAIEFKYVDSEEKVKIALTGILEDISGYSGSQDWNRFIAVIYQTAPFESEARFKEDLRRVKASGWIPILVHGERRGIKRKSVTSIVPGKPKRPKKKT